MEEQQNPQQTPITPQVVQEKPPTQPVPPVSGPLAQLEAWLYEMLVAKAPFQFPKQVKDVIAEYGPWITLGIGIITLLVVIPGVNAALTLSSMGTFGSLVASYIGPMFYIALAVLAAQLVVMFMSVPMLLKRQRKGWQLVFYANVASVVYSVVNAFAYGYFGFGSLLFGLVGAAVGFYVLFQVRSYYKN